ncbi:branched-chain amino acid aminotransferase 1, mitochondrial isoform X3 [Morus notabilis]|uniref:branched-chain amino acid aminotransferase 1, mitochondrial isoform X3 n=1 Tax=Morus notabilis TaxID=981085 RepID=UPI000CED0D9C|nr:branched-chain amino acid aminotransferase 1, mitochondrial isoform X3 [Morus notabilis]
MAPPPVQTSGETTPHRDGEQYANVNWDELGFDAVPTDYMYVMKCSIEEGDFSHGKLIPYGNIELSPSAGVLNYGQGLFEGLKAYRREDGRIQLFRPEQNALRMKMGAERMCMLSPTVEQFVDAVKQTVIANNRFGRPALKLFVEDKLQRAMPGGTGGVKSITNYSPVYLAQTKAKAKGYSDVLFLDSAHGKYVEELAVCNIFIVKGNVVSTPAIQGTILPGVTRKSIIEIALGFGYQVEERLIPVEDLLEADEVFCTGTAVIVNSVGGVTYQDKRVEYKTGKETLSKKLYETLIGIQTGRVEDKMGWTLEVN